VAQINIVRGNRIVANVDMVAQGEVTKVILTGPSGGQMIFQPTQGPTTIERQPLSNEQLRDLQRAETAYFSKYEVSVISGGMITPCGTVMLMDRGLLDPDLTVLIDDALFMQQESLVPAHFVQGSLKISDLPQHGLDLEEVLLTDQLDRIRASEGQPFEETDTIYLLVAPVGPEEFLAMMDGSNQFEDVPGDDGDALMSDLLRRRKRVTDPDGDMPPQV